MLGRVRPGPVRRTRNAYTWCVERSSGVVTAVFGKGGRSLLVTATAPPVSASALRHAYPRRRALARGVWRLSTRSGRIAGVRGGRVRFLGVADHSLLKRPKLLGRQLRRAGL
jgi:hypothetical protein